MRILEDKDYVIKKGDFSPVLFFCSIPHQTDVFSVLSFKCSFYMLHHNGGVHSYIYSDNKFCSWSSHGFSSP